MIEIGIQILIKGVLMCKNMSFYQNSLKLASFSRLWALTNPQNHTFYLLKLLTKIIENDYLRSHIPIWNHFSGHTINLMRKNSDELDKFC